MVNGPGLLVQGSPKQVLHEDVHLDDWRHKRDNNNDLLKSCDPAQGLHKNGHGFQEQHK